MVGQRRLRILARLLGVEAAPLETKRLCEVCVEVTGASGAGIMLMSGDVAAGSVCTTNAVSGLIEQLQYELGEGPCIDAHRYDTPVVEPDLADPTTPRWIAFSGPAVAAGARAVFGFPLQVGSVRLGALSLYCDRPGSLTVDQHNDALVLAEVCAQAVLVVQSTAQTGLLAAELESGSDFQYIVHQASGMVAAQLGVSVGHALIRLRGHAFGNEHRLVDVARDVVDRILRFDPTEDDTPIAR